jgi:hypothetical protein
LPSVTENVTSNAPVVVRRMLKTCGMFGFKVLAVASPYVMPIEYAGKAESEAVGHTTEGASITCHVS